MFKRIIAFTSAVLLLLPSLAGCSRTKNYLSVGIAACAQVFNPLFASGEGDLQVVDLLFDNLLTTERGGQIVYNAIDGETLAFNGEDYTYSGPADVAISEDEESGVSTVTITLREGMTFSDGKPVTADDLFFTYYVLCDSKYEGYSSVGKLDIVGLSNYQTQTPVSVYTKYQQEAASIYKKGWPKELGADLSDPDTWFWTTLKSNWAEDVQNTIDYCVTKYSGFAEKYIGFTANQVKLSASLQAALSMVVWGFATVDEGVLTTLSGKTFDLNAGIYPSAVDFFEETFLKYEGDAVTYAKEESAVTADILQLTKDAYVQYWGPQDPSVSYVDCSYITGIERVDSRTLSIALNTLTRQDLHTLLDVYIAPLHYYGDAASFDAATHQPGFTRNELEPLQEKNAEPLGSGAYSLAAYENGTARLTANTAYWRGTPAIAEVHLSEVSEIDRISDVAGDALDITTVSGANNALAAVTTHNIAEKLSGNVITTVPLAGDTLEYVGLNTALLTLDEDEPAASLYLRQAFFALMEAYLENAVDAAGYNGVAIHTPVSFDSTLAQGGSFGSIGSTESSSGSESATTTAVDTALSYLLNAGYTIGEENTVTKAPEGGRTAFSAVCLKDSAEAPSPARQLLEQLKSAMDTIGLTLTITAVSSKEELDAALKGGKYHLFADQLTREESLDLSRFHSESAENYFRYADDALDEALDEADPLWYETGTVAVYRQVLEDVDAACIILPVYQTQNALLYNTERLSAFGLPGDLTRHWGWADAVRSLTLS